MKTPRNIEFLIFSVCTVLAMFSGILTIVSLSGVWFIYYRQGKVRAGILLGLLILAFIGLSMGAGLVVNGQSNANVVGIQVLEFSTWGSLFGLTALWIFGSRYNFSQKIIAGAILSVVLGAVAVMFSAEGLDSLILFMLEGFKDSIALPEDLVPDLGMLKTAVLAIMPLAMLVVAGINGLLGSLMTRRSRVNEAIRSFVLPTALVWCFIASLAGPLLAWRLALNWQTSAMILMFSFVVLFLFSLQGYAIAQFFLHLRKAEGLGRMLPLLLVLLMALVPVLNVLLFLGLAFFGVSETWVPWRRKNPKPDEKETYPS